MAYGDTPYDQLLKEAWNGFCERLKGASEVVFRDTAPATSLARAEGFRYLSRYISRAFNVVLEYNDPLYPQLWRHQTPTNKYGGDNPDALNLRARIDGEHTYRVVGDRGNAEFLSFTAYLRDEPWGSRPFVSMGYLFGHELHTEWDGSFELILSPQSHPGNWLRTGPGAYRFSIRQFFGAWERARPMVARIERVGAEGPPPPLTAERMAEALGEAVEHLLADTKGFADYIEVGQASPNQFVRRQGEQGASPWRIPVDCYWRVQEDEALIIEVVPPRAHWWSFELNNYWMNSLDYRYHLSSLNFAQAVLEDDGLVRVAIAHRDPGIPNWLETGGHCEGRVGLRWVLAESAPVPQTRLVKLAEMPKLLPPNARRISPEERRDQLRRRNIGVDRRFRV